MFTKHDRNPTPTASNRTRCPVCSQPVYSRAGIHPQCAVRQADPPRLTSKGPKASAADSLTEGEIP